MRRVDFEGIVEKINGEFMTIKGLGGNLYGVKKDKIVSFKKPCKDMTFNEVFPITMINIPDNKKHEN